MTTHPLKTHGFIQDLRFAKRRATHLKPEKIRIDKLSSQLEKLHTEGLLEVLCKVIAEEIHHSLENKSMACCEPAVQIHSCYLSNLREKVDRNFDKRPD